MPAEARGELSRRFSLLRLGAKAEDVQRLPAEWESLPSAPNARQTVMMQARATILVEIERRQIINSLSTRKAILQFLDDIKLFRTGAPTSDDRSPHRADYDVLDEAVNRSTEGKAGLSLRSVYNWIKAKEAGGAKALVPQIKSKPKRADQIDWLPGFLNFYARPAKPTITHALDMYRASLEDPASAPTYKQVRLALGKLGNVDRHKGREGALTLKARMAYVSRSTEGLMPTSIYTADGKTFDAEVAHMLTGQPFRPEITSVLDVATRKCVGFSVSLKENVIAVSDALRRASVENGIPAIFYVDNGPGYKNKTFDDDATGMMARLGTTKMHSIAYNSQARGIIERFNGSCWNPLARELPTYVGTDMDREARKKAFEVTRRDIKASGTSRILIGWDAFIEGCQKKVDQYNNAPHSGLGKIVDPESGKKRHMTPNEAWTMHVNQGFEPVSVNPAEEDDLFRPHEIRTVRRCLIEWNTNKYFSMDLEQYHGDKVMVAYDVQDGNRLWVREIDQFDGEQVPGRLICLAEFAGNEERYVSVSYEQRAIEKRAESQLRRINSKKDAVEQQLRADIFIEANAQAPMGMLDDAGTFEPVAIEQPQSPSIATLDARQGAGKPRKRVFATDAELAEWALDHPDELTENQKKILRGCVTRRTDQDLFRLHGIDVEQLRTLLRKFA